MKNTLVKYLEDIADKVEKRIKKEHDKILKYIVKIEASALAQNNIPSVDATSIHQYVIRTYGEYRTLFESANLQFQGDLEEFLNEVQIGNLEDKVSAFNKNISQIESTLNGLEHNLNRIPIAGQYYAYVGGTIGLFVLALGESFFNVGSLLRIGDIILVGAIVGLVIGFAQIIGVKSAMLVIRDKTEGKQRWKWRVITIAVAFVVSLILGFLRYSFVADKGMPVWALNPITFASINMLFIIASALVTERTVPTQKQIDEWDERRNIKKDINTLKIEMKLLEAKREAVIKEKEHVLIVNGRAKEFQRNFKKLVSALFETAIGAWKTENLIKRPDKQSPPSFEAPLPQLFDDSE